MRVVVLAAVAACMLFVGCAGMTAEERLTLTRELVVLGKEVLLTEERVVITEPDGTQRVISTAALTPEAELLLGRLLEKPEPEPSDFELFLEYLRELEGR